MANKITKKEMFANIMAVEGLTDEMRAFLQKQIDAEERKAVKGAERRAEKAVEKRSDYAELEDRIFEVMAEVGEAKLGKDWFTTLTEKGVELKSQQALTVRLTAMAKAGRIEKFKEKASEGNRYKVA